MKLENVTYQLISNKELLYFRRFEGQAQFKYIGQSHIIPIKFDVERTAMGHKVHIVLQEEIDYPVVSVISQIRSWVEDNIV